MLTISFCKRLLPDAREVVEMQLKFLDLLVAKENGAGPLDAAVRADLIDLMARVLVVVFQEEVDCLYGGTCHGARGDLNGQLGLVPNFETNG
jgi:hypothetical protein